MYTVTADRAIYRGSYYDSQAGFALQFPNIDIAIAIMRAHVVSVTDPNGSLIQGITRHHAVGNIVYFQ